MSRLAQRVKKMEAALPAEPENVEVFTPTSSLAEALAEINAEAARFEAMSPLERIRHLRAEIAKWVAEAAAGPKLDQPGRTPGLNESLHACIVKMVKDDFPSQRHEIRGYELTLLREAGFDGAALAMLEARHQWWKDLPWQWRHNNEPLPATAQAILDAKLNEPQGSAGAIKEDAKVIASD